MNLTKFYGGVGKPDEKTSLRSNPVAEVYAQWVHYVENREIEYKQVLEETVSMLAPYSNAFSTVTDADFPACPPKYQGIFYTALLNAEVAKRVIITRDECGSGYGYRLERGILELRHTESIINVDEVNNGCIINYTRGALLGWYARGGLFVNFGQGTFDMRALGGVFINDGRIPDCAGCESYPEALYLEPLKDNEWYKTPGHDPRFHVMDYLPGEGAVVDKKLTTLLVQLRRGNDTENSVQQLRTHVANKYTKK